MNPIFLVVGPPAVGKSTACRALAASFPKSLHIAVDDIRHMVVSGLTLPSAVWSDELMQQITLARTSVAQMALAYHDAGFVVVMDDFWDPHLAPDYAALFSCPQFHKIILLPSQEEAHRRNLHRSGESPAQAYIDEGIRIVYEQLHTNLPHLAQAGWTVVDTTRLSVAETVTTLLELDSGGKQAEE